MHVCDTLGLPRLAPAWQGLRLRSCLVGAPNQPCQKNWQFILVWFVTKIFGCQYGYIITPTNFCQIIGKVRVKKNP